MTTSTLATASAALDDLLNGTTTSGPRQKRKKTKKPVKIDDEDLDPVERLQRQLDEKRKVEAVAKTLKNSSKLRDEEVAARERILEMREAKSGKKNKKKRKAVDVNFEDSD